MLRLSKKPDMLPWVPHLGVILTVQLISKDKFSACYRYIGQLKQFSLVCPALINL